MAGDPHLRASSTGGRAPGRVSTAAVRAIGRRTPLIHDRWMRTTPESSWLALPQPFLAKEAHAAGLSSTTISGAVRRRHIIPVAASVYAVPESWVELDPQGLHLAMTRAAGASIEGSVVSHQSA